MLLTSWNSSTGAAIFALWGPWAYFNYGGGNVPYWSAVGIVNDVGAAAIYGSEQVDVAKGIGIVLEGVHVENNNAHDAHGAYGSLGRTNLE